MGIFQTIGKSCVQTIKFSRIILIMFGYFLVFGLLMLPFAGEDATAGLGETNPIGILISIIGMFVLVFIQGGALSAVRDFIKTGSFKMSDLIENGKKYYTRLLSYVGLILGATIVIMVIIAVIIAGILAVSNNIFTQVIVGALLTAAAITAMIFFLYPIYIIVAEDTGPIAALKKGLEISKNNFWQTLLLMLILFIGLFLASFLIGFLLIGISAFLPNIVGRIITIIISSVLQSAFTMLIMVVIMNYYLSLTTGAGKQEPQAPTTAS